MKNEKLRMLDLIQKELKNKCKKIIKFQKYDGISLECYVAQDTNIDDGISEIKKVCKSLKLNPINIEINKDKNNLFLLQFPEFVPEYTTKELEALYKDSYDRLIKDLKNNDVEHKVTKDLIIRNKSVFIKQAIISFYNSNTNKYKGTLKTYLQDEDIWKKAETFFDNYIETQV